MSTHLYDWYYNLMQEATMSGGISEFAREEEEAAIQAEELERVQVDGEFIPVVFEDPDGTAPFVKTDMASSLGAALDGAQQEFANEHAQRKATPLFSGVLNYFPDALLEVARVSRVGNEQHNPGQPLHWAKGKSTDHEDALARHLLDRGTMDSDGVRHSGKVAWRALAMLQTEIENEREAQAAEQEGPEWVLTVNLPVTDTDGEVYDFRESVLESVKVRDEAHGRALMNDMAERYVGRIVSLYRRGSLVANARRVLYMDTQEEGETA